MALVDLISASVSGQLRPSGSVPVAACPRDERPPDVVEVRRLGPRVVVVVGLAGVLLRQPALGLLVAQSLGRMCPQPVAEPHGMPTPRGVRPADVEDDPVAAMYVQPLLPPRPGRPRPHMDRPGSLLASPVGSPALARTRVARVVRRARRGSGAAGS